MSKFCLVFILLLGGCRGGDSVPIKPTDKAAQGTTTGGGGDLKPAEQVQVKDLINQVKYSKFVVTAWFSRRHLTHEERKKWCLKYPDIQCSVGTKLFDGEKTIFDVLDDLQIETRTDGACLDNEGSPKDGSINGKKSGSICISIYNLQRKLTRDIFRNHIAALIAHEVSHILNTTEAEAKFLQDQMLEKNLVFLPVTQVIAKSDETENKLASFLRSLRQWYSTHTQTNNNFNGACAGYEFFGFMYRDLYHQNIYSPHVMMMKPYDTGLLLGSLVKLKALTNYVCTQDISRPDDKKRYQFYYETYLNKKDRVTSSVPRDEFERLASKDVWINRITSRELLLSEGKEVVELYTEAIKAFKKFKESYFSVY